MKNEIITIFISEYLTHELAKGIAFLEWQSTRDDFIIRVIESIYGGKDSDCFNVIAVNSNNNVIGRVYCEKSRENPKRWYHGDLVVASKYRRMKIASQMIKTAIQRILDMGGEILNCYIDKTNTVSIGFHKSLGFIEKPHVQFDDMENEDEIMLEYTLEKQYNAIPVTIEYARYPFHFYRENADIMNVKHISFPEFREIFFKDDPTEQNFLVCKGILPVAWLRISGLNNTDTAYIDMLAVCDKYKRQGIGTYAVGFAEDYLKSRNFIKINTRVNDDNFIALSFYKKCGYNMTEDNIFEKNL